MLISERQLRSIVREMLDEQSLASGSGTATAGPVTSSRKKGKGGYEYEIFSNGKIQVVSKGGKPLAAPKVLNQAQSVAVAKEQIALGNKGSTLARVASGELVFDSTVTTAPVAADGAAGAAQPGLIIIGRQDFFPLDGTVGSATSKAVSALIGQGHGFVVIVDPSTKMGQRYDFGRYPEAAKCPDDRWVTKAGQAVAGKEQFNKIGVHTMGIAMRKSGKVVAQVSPDGKQITNLPQFAKSVRKSDDSPGNIVVIPVTNAAGALAYANSMVGKCFPYALPGFGALTTASTLNCGTFAQKVLQAGAPEQVISVEARTLVDTPDALYETAAGMGYQTSTF